MFHFTKLMYRQGLLWNKVIKNSQLRPLAFSWFESPIIVLPFDRAERFLPFLIFTRLNIIYVYARRELALYHDDYINIFIIC